MTTEEIKTKMPMPNNEQTITSKSILSFAKMISSSFKFVVDVSLTDEVVSLNVSSFLTASSPVIFSFNVAHFENSIDNKR